MKYKAKVYRDAIGKLGVETDFACVALEYTAKNIYYSRRFSGLFTGKIDLTWMFSDYFPGSIQGSTEYYAGTELGQITREIALELAAHLEETGEMDKILVE